MGARLRRRALGGLVLGSLVLAGCTGGAESDDGEDAAEAPSEESSAADPGAEESAAQLGFDDLAIGAEVPNPQLCADGVSYSFGANVFSDTQDYAVAWQDGLTEVADALGCVELFTLVDNADPATAIANINTLVQQEVDGVILFQIIAAAQEGVMDALNEAGIPAVAHAVPAPGAPFVSPSDSTAGVTGGRALADAAVEKWPGETPWLILGTHPETGAVSDNRLGGVEEGVREVLADLPDDRVIEIDSQSTPDTAFSRTLNVLAQIPEGDPILFSGINDDVVVGMFRAIVQDGRRADSLAMGIGGLFPSGVQAVCENPDVFVATVDFLPETAGRYMIPALIGLARGIEVTDTIDMAVELLDVDAARAKYPDFEPCSS